MRSPDKPAFWTTGRIVAVTLLAVFLIGPALLVGGWWAREQIKLSRLWKYYEVIMVRGT